MTTMSDEERTEMARNMVDLSQEISTQASQKTVDPGHLMRLMAAGISQCLVAQAVALNGGRLPDV